MHFGTSDAIISKASKLDMPPPVTQKKGKKGDGKIERDTNRFFFVPVRKQFPHIANLVVRRRRVAQEVKIYVLRQDYLIKFLNFFYRPLKRSNVSPGSRLGLRKDNPKMIKSMDPLPPKKTSFEEAIEIRVIFYL